MVSLVPDIEYALGSNSIATILVLDRSPFREPTIVRWRERQPGSIRVEINLDTAATLQWWFAGSPDRPLPGATEPTLHLPNVSAADEGSYFLEADLGAVRIGAAQFGQWSTIPIRLRFLSSVGRRSRHSVRESR